MYCLSFIILKVEVADLQTYVFDIKSILGRRNMGVVKPPHPTSVRPFLHPLDADKLPPETEIQQMHDFKNILPLKSIASYP